jgi:superfamily II DNA/RNA helicase
MMKRIYCGEGRPVPLQALLILPTKELAVQVAADVLSLVHTAPQVDTDNLVHLCIANQPGGLDGVSSPIIIGTPHKLLSALRSSGMHTLDLLKISYCVVDEADRCLSIAGRYSPPVEGATEREENPTRLLVSALAKTQPEGGMQLVAASATVGRPLRRELYRLLQGGDGYGELPVIRPENVEGEPVRSGPQSGSTRQIGIPKSIEHVAIMCEGGDTGSKDDLNVKLAVAKDLWTKSTARKACLFVPTAEVYH